MPQPDWNEIFTRRPDLESPGYQETVEQVREKQPDYEKERLRQKMQQIHKEKQSTKNKSRNQSASRKDSASPDATDSLFSANKGRRKKR